MSESCMLCGRDEFSHHEFSPRARGCRCSLSSWDGAVMYTAICRDFEEGATDGHCKTCDHDSECHASNPPGGRRQRIIGAMPDLPDPDDPDSPAGEKSEPRDATPAEDVKGAFIDPADIKRAPPGCVCGGGPTFGAGLLMTGEHPECPRCHSLRLPDGRCVNGSLCLNARVAPEQCPSCRGTGRMCGHKHCSVPIKHACAACGGTGTAHALTAASAEEQPEPTQKAPASDVKSSIPGNTGRCGTCGGEGWTLPDPAGPRHTCTACGGSGSTTGGAG